MANLILPNRWRRQPAFPTAIHFGNPLTAALAFAWHAGAPDVLVNPAGPLYRSTNNTTSSGYGEVGRAIYCSTAQVNLEWASYQPIVTSDGAGLGNFTMMVLANPASAGDGTNMEHMLAQKNDAGGSPFEQVSLLAHATSAAAYSSGSVALFSFNAAGSGIAAAGVCDGQYHVWTGLRTIGGDLQLFRDGRFAATSGALTSRNLIGTTARYLAIGSRGNGTTNSFRDKCAFAAGWNRALTKGEITALSENPWQLFKPLPRRAYFFAVGAGATDILATTGTEAWNGLTAGIMVATNVAATTGVETWNGLGASINARVSITAGTGVETWNGFAANIIAPTGIIATTGVETWNGISASVSIGGALQIQATTGTELWGGLSATVTPGGAVVGGNRANRVFRPKGKRVIYQQ